MACSQGGDVAVASDHDIPPLTLDGDQFHGAIKVYRFLWLEVLLLPSYPLLTTIVVVLLPPRPRHGFNSDDIAYTVTTLPTVQGTMSMDGHDEAD